MPKAEKLDARPAQPDRASLKWIQPLTSKDVVERIDELLEVTYRSDDLGNVSDVLSKTIYIVLSLNTRESVYQEIYRTLRKTFPKWKDVEKASLNDLAAILEPGGLQKQRAKYLKTLLRRVRQDNVERFGLARTDRSRDLTLEYLRNFTDRDAEALLLSLPGVGKKTARCVMSYALDREQFAVDTHVRRIFTRLGLVADTGEQPDHDAFQSLVPPKLRKRMQINLIHHGRAVCAGPAPKCGQCILVSFCDRGRNRPTERDNQPVAVDLFAGAGGLGHGFQSAGWRVSLAVERDRDAAQTYRVNHPGTPVIEGDVAKLTAGEIARLCPGMGEPHAILAGPPCQGYSAAGTRNPRDPKNLLYKHVNRLATDLGARLVVMENVPGVRRVNGVGFVDQILTNLRRGHNAEAFEVLAANFGVPQNRRRLLFLARRKDLGAAPGPPAPSHRLNGSGDLPLTPRLDSLLKGELELRAGTQADPLILEDGTVIPNASTMTHSKRVVAKIAGIPPGKGPISYRRLEPDLARTLVAGHRALPVHPWLDRTISVREAARIQGFPDDYVFCGPRASQPLQVANAVPPPLASALATHLLNFLGDESATAGARKAASARRK